MELFSTNKFNDNLLKYIPLDKAICIFVSTILNCEQCAIAGFAEQTANDMTKCIRFIAFAIISFAESHSFQFQSIFKL